MIVFLANMQKTSKPRDDVKPAPTIRNVSILSRRTALNAPKAGMKISQLTKAQKANKPPNKTTTQQPTTEPLIDTTKNVPQYQVSVGNGFWPAAQISHLCM